MTAPPDFFPLNNFLYEKSQFIAACATMRFVCTCANQRTTFPVCRHFTNTDCLCVWMRPMGSAQNMRNSQPCNIVSRLRSPSQIFTRRTIHFLQPLLQCDL